MSDGFAYHEHQPGGALGGIVDRIWALRAELPAGHVERLVPDGTVEFVVNVGDPVLEHRPGRPPFEQARVLAVGPSSQVTLLETTGAVDWIGVRFRPEAAQRALGMAPDLLLDRIVPADEIGVGLAPSVLDELASTADLDARAARFSARLLPAIETSLDPLVTFARQWIERTEGMSTTDDVARRAGVSVRTLQRRFHVATGLTPKRYGRLVRFGAVMRRLAARPRASTWRSILESGYYDQSHFLRDFRHFVGVPPAQYWEGHPELSLAIMGGSSE